MAEEGRGLILEENKEPKSCCSCCCVLRWTLCGAVLLAGAAAALILCVPDEKPKHIGKTNEEFDELAQVVLQLVQDHKLREEAKQVEGDAEWGKDLKADSEKIMDLLRAMEGQLSPQVAAKIGIEITSDDIARILGVSGTHGHQFNLEDSKKGAFQGDMVPEDENQLKQFVSQAESAQKVTRKVHGSFGAGKPWAKGIVKFCYHENVPDGVKDAVRLAIQQYKKSVPCIQFNEVGRLSNDECEESPAVFITSENTGCWSYVGELTHRNAQGLNLQSPGCDSVGTVLHELGHALGMAHEQARPDRDKYVEIHESRIQSGKEHNFDISSKGDTERPYDLLSIMHYDADSFSTSKKPTITAKDKAYALYTDDPDDYDMYRMGNRVGLTQLDADQLADLYRDVNGLCVSHLLGDGGGEGASCTDLMQNGEEWKDRYDQKCHHYVKMEDFLSGRLGHLGLLGARPHRRLFQIFRGCLLLRLRGRPATAEMVLGMRPLSPCLGRRLQLQTGLLEPLWRDQCNHLWQSGLYQSFPHVSGGRTLQREVQLGRLDPGPMCLVHGLHHQGLPLQTAPGRLDV